MTGSKSPAHILVVDDEPDLRTLYELTLLREGYQVDTAGDLQQARKLLAEHSFDVLITDMRLPDGVGLSLITELKIAQRSERCVVITAYGSAENAVEALKGGAFDYLTKPVDLKQFRRVIASAVNSPVTSVLAMAQTIPVTQAGAGALGQRALDRLVGQSVCMRQIKERILKVATSMAPVLVTGESGTGKELVAYAIHANSHRAKGPWVAVNCSAIPEALLEAEFFGAKKGAYTGSQVDREGFFQAASGGTLFLDEIGDLPLAMQSKLLRAIQERRIRPLGSTQEDVVDVRIVSATHKQLAEEVEKGDFRQDLFYRLNVIDMLIAPLRERTEDLPELCNALLSRIADEAGIATPALQADAMEQLASLPLAGNVRELENLLHRAVALGDGKSLQFEPPNPLHRGTRQSADSLPIQADPEMIPGDLQRYLDELERSILSRALLATDFNRTAAATRLGLSLRQIRYRIARLRIDTPNQDDPVVTPD
ncbi:sigma-54 dependent transcriptional regulator [Rhodoferax sp.]|uniref:sigma-54-dependent transcriptional regulator n=1 Tax=Rhodoferax sp. TaxID=50421 RepID=UPI00262EED71|nr:sigma-54 dependent transcriptional regulator [Rhodoferax sp.]MDD2919765.1 sigma-54 dependent transcriptional regulator [Rhodoferax sp.]